MVLAFDLIGVPPVRPVAAVIGERGDDIQPNLLSHVPFDADRHGGRIGQEGAEKSHRAELQRKPEAIMVTTALAHPGAIGVVEQKISRQLIGRQLAGKAPVAGALLGGQEVSRHGVLSSNGRLLRHPSTAQKTPR